MTLPTVVEALLCAVAARDVDAVASCFTEDASYAYAVPLPALQGRAAIAGMFKGLVAEFDQIRWDVVASCVEGDRVWLERVDRFWVDGREVAIECAGVVELDGDHIRAVRDYVDLQTWMQRKDGS